MKRMFLPFLTFIFLGASIADVNGAPITSPSDPSLSASTLIDFETFAPPGAFGDMTLYDLNFSTVASFGYISDSYSGSYNTSGYAIHNTYAANAFSTIYFKFPTDVIVNAFGFNFGASDYAWTLSAYNAANSLLESIIISPTYASNSGDFFGIVNSGIAWAQLSGPPGDYVMIDNFRYTRTPISTSAPIPEPSTLLLVGGGLAGLGLLARKRRI